MRIRCNSRGAAPISRSVRPTRRERNGRVSASRAIAEPWITKPRRCATSTSAPTAIRPRAAAGRRYLTLRYDRMMLLLDPTPLARGLAGRTVEVVNYPDGRFAVRHDGVALPFRMFDKIETVSPGAIVENKRLGAALAFARELQASYPPNRRRGDPRRRRPPNNLEAPGMPTKGRPSRKILATDAAE